MADETCIIDPQHACWGLQKANMLEEQLKEYQTYLSSISIQGLTDELK